MPTKLIKYNNYKHKQSKWVTFDIIKSILKMIDPLSVKFTRLQINLNTYNNILKNSIQLAKEFIMKNYLQI